MSAAKQPAKATAVGKKYLDNAKTESVETIFDLQKELGRGTFSTVRLAQHKKTREKVALKRINKAAVGDKTNMLLTEVQILQAISHPNIITLRDIFETSTTLDLVMELVTGGELFDRIVQKGNYTEVEAAPVMRQILEACAYLHGRGIVHRDLKPENLLYENEHLSSRIKLADFGLSKLCGDSDVLKTACGTPGYVAPEVLQGRGYAKPVDIWSCGVILYILLCGFPPFYEENTAALFEQIIEGKFDFPSPYWDNISFSAKDLVSRMLVTNPAGRITSHEALKHPWVLGSTPGAGAVQPSARLRLKKAIFAAVALAKFNAAAV